MNRIIICALAIVLAIASYSCKKGKTVVPTPPPDPIDSPVVISYSDYTALKPGNYWIYQNYRLDSVDGEAHAMATYDSCYVEKDTLINGHTYHKYMEPLFGSIPTSPHYRFDFLRDSLGYTINDGGLIFASTQDFSSIFRTFLYLPGPATPDTMIITEQMRFDVLPFTVTAGTFKTITFRRIFHLPPTMQYGPMREYVTMYARGVGIIRKTTAFYTEMEALTPPCVIMFNESDYSLNCWFSQPVIKPHQLHNTGLYTRLYAPHNIRHLQCRSPIMCRPGQQCFPAYVPVMLFYSYQFREYT